VYDGPSELKVPALAPRLRAQKDLAVLAERPHRRVLRREGETAVVCRDAVPVRLEDLSEVLQRPQVLREDEHFLVDGFEESAQARGLHIRGNRHGLLSQFLQTLPLVEPEERALSETSQRLGHGESAAPNLTLQDEDRKSTRLNSSHQIIS